MNQRANVGALSALHLNGETGRLPVQEPQARDVDFPAFPNSITRDSASRGLSELQSGYFFLSTGCVEPDLPFRLACILAIIFTPSY